MTGDPGKSASLTQQGFSGGHVARKVRERVVLLVRWLVLTGAILVASYLLEGIHVRTFFSAFLAAALLGILNVFFRPILIFLTLPINIVTLGLFTFVINALLLKMVSGVIPGFEVHGFWTAVFGSFLISVVSWILHGFLFGKGRVAHTNLKQTDGDGWDR